MDGRYEVFSSNGKGVFSIVVRARDLQRRDETGEHPEVGCMLVPGLGRAAAFVISHA